MGRASTARRIAVAAAFGGTGVGAVWASVYGLVNVEAKMARKRIGPADKPLPCDGTYGEQLAGAPLSMVMLGDSSAAGLGVLRAADAPAARIAAGLAHAARRPVRLTCVARVGATSAALEDQVTSALPARPHVAVVMVGSNDVTHKVAPAVSVRMLEQAVRRLREAGCEVVVGTCPDLGTLEPLAQPLRWLARRASRELAAAQTIGVVEAGGRTVSLGDLLGPEFEADPAAMFSEDGFHPSSEGYARAADVLLPSVLAALGFAVPDVAGAVPSRGEGVRAVADAAVAAADRAGSEVTATQVAGRDRGPAGRWALLQRRRAEPAPSLQEAAEAPKGG
ncbi:lysophospholipase L1-like esterase [Motilibacter peucedani]|uniref:Lysophospholipase L1-like esterase n=1 Tax=Motilibacter peucedani TaxID=598650 RepID=A0A420XVB7_9ACTN|nr:SGNH/GDSL hydrolase family protein [Motilibacter peucedani]RKS80717.1 lysophospholipase L1-like esterase [Motilibacter peucedani]